MASGDVQTAPSGVPYKCKGDAVPVMTTSSQRQTNVSDQEAIPSSSRGIDAIIGSTGCNPSKNDADTSVVVPDDSNTQHISDTRHPNTMSGPNDKEPSPADVNPNPEDAENARERPNSMYQHNSMSAYGKNTQNVRDPNPTYPQNAPLSQPDLSPEPANVNSLQPITGTHQQENTSAFKTAESDDNPCSQPYENTNEGDSASACRPDEEDCSNRILPMMHQEDCVPSLSPSTDDGVPFTQPSAVTNQEETLASCDDHDSIQPYAVRYQEEDDGNNIPTASGAAAPDGQKNGVDAGDGDIVPYAVAYAPASVVNDVPNDLDPNPMYTPSSLNPNPMYVQNALNPNPMYVPNVGFHLTCGTFAQCLYGWLCHRPTVIAVILGLLLMCGTFAGLYLTRNDNVHDRQEPTAAAVMDITATPGKPTCCGSPRETVAYPTDISKTEPTSGSSTTTSPTFPSTSNSSQDNVEE
uniref:Uncharacterized protein n=1 Tax=Branchiostoma floridae TaxID=7739 RepID=C3YAU0_BRAFL|eukprot:XP_002606531.1 hypothetical protein BRAFLDRAFT_102553 [Branchiostoma floridae]